MTVGALLLTGCVSNVPLPGPGEGRRAVFVHPQTGEIQHCETPEWMAREIFTAIFYAMCKTTAEDQGFVRQRDPGQDK